MTLASPFMSGPTKPGPAIRALRSPLGSSGITACRTRLFPTTPAAISWHGLVDLCIVGTDRTTARGDVCNKIGTYLKALAAHDNGVPFYVALPSPTIDFTVDDGIKEIPIEQRSGDEVSKMTGRTAQGTIETVEIVAPGSAVANYAFDVTPAKYITGLITERGVLKADRDTIANAFPERASRQRQ
jgi:methylthioribose-1-phosphate isomerase